jgi:uncharacterized protein (TIGR03032 family)
MPPRGARERVGISTSCFLTVAHETTVLTEALPVDERMPTKPVFQYVYSESFAPLLQSLNATLFVTTYQAGKLMAVRAREGRVSILLRTFDQAMGLVVDQHRLTIGTRFQIWQLRNAPDIALQIEPRGTHDACYVPRVSHVTGDIRCHEIAWADDEIWVVNTRFSCLCTLDADYSFVPRWFPPFVTKLAAEDRCHLNGLAIRDGKPSHVTVLGETNTADGWRENKANGGCVLDVSSGERVVRGLCMPHSPRMYRDRLWVLDSGTGRLLVVDQSNGKTETVAELPGYARGLCFHGSYAFVGLSRIRETSTFGGVPIAEQAHQLKCGIWVVDILRGKTVAFLEFTAGVEEIFDDRLLPEIRYPTVIGLQKETIHGTFVVPRNADPEPM